MDRGRFRDPPLLLLTPLKFFPIFNITSLCLVLPHPKTKNHSKTCHIFIKQLKIKITSIYDKNIFKICKSQTFLQGVRA